jgi:hypothetical protein
MRDPPTSGPDVLWTTGEGGEPRRWGNQRYVVGGLTSVVRLNDIVYTC